MKPIGNYNRFPKTFKLPKLEKGQQVTYRLTDDYKRKVIISKEGQTIERWPETIKIPTIDTIQLTYKDEKGEERTDLFDIGLVKNVDRDGRPTVESYWFEAQALRGELTLTGGAIHDEQLYAFFELCNRNASNPNRDMAVAPMFYRVDKEADAEQKNKLVDLELECLLYIRNCTPKEIKKLAAAFQFNENDTVAELRARLNDFARKDPKKFNNLATSKDVEIKATVQRAYTAQVIKYNPQQHKVMWGSNGSTIASLKRVEGVTWQEQFVDWIKTAGKGGTDTFENIKKLMDSDTKE